jgi:NADP-dependent 3-hydroxy acid dehydrogenase YdfG
MTESAEFALPNLLLETDSSACRLRKTFLHLNVSVMRLATKIVSSTVFNTVRFVKVIYRTARATYQTKIIFPADGASSLSYTHELQWTLRPRFLSA